MCSRVLVVTLPVERSLQNNIDPPGVGRGPHGGARLRACLSGNKRGRLPRSRSLSLLCCTRRLAACPLRARVERKRRAIEPDDGGESPELQLSSAGLRDPAQIGAPVASQLQRLRLGLRHVQLQISTEVSAPQSHSTARYSHLTFSNATSQETWFFKVETYPTSSLLLSSPLLSSPLLFSYSSLLSSPLLLSASFPR
ncbi:unnamed protein product [Pleuronectes platessa]|uniref:Uncharacterized protein n=1 Tax=Pleuronectes platessa TaxID=8262 RepID=A0A9N7UFE8_PLEPL|nr:unnamed protein product [Pleuronectes platessa]